MCIENCAKCKEVHDEKQAKKEAKKNFCHNCKKPCNEDKSVNMVSMTPKVPRLRKVKPRIDV